MLAGEKPTVYGDGYQSRDFTYIDNVVAGNLAAADAPQASGQVFNIACGRQFSLLDLLNSINNVLGTQIEAKLPKHVPAMSAKVWPTSRPPVRCWDTSRASILKKGCGVRSSTIAR